MTKQKPHRGRSEGEKRPGDQLLSCQSLETLWVVKDDVLMWDPQETEPSGAASLILHLAKTLGLDVKRWPGLIDAIGSRALGFDEAFLVSDEHGVVPASDCGGPHGKRFALGYQRLLSCG